MKYTHHMVQTRPSHRGAEIVGILLRTQVCCCHNSSCIWRRRGRCRYLSAI
jgi:hypothetical protein